MKKNLFFTLLIVIFGVSTQSSAQTENGFFFSFNAGYNIPSGSVNLSGFSFINEQVNADVSKRENVKTSLGKGINFGVAAGYMFNRHVGTQLEFNYLLGGKTVFPSTYFDSDSSSNVDYVFYANMLQFKPSLIIAAGMENINPYAKFGPLFGKGAIYREYESTSDQIIKVDDGMGNITQSKTTTRITEKSTYNGGLALGFQAAVGVSFGVSTSLSLFGELNMVNMSYSPTKGELTEKTLNGVDQLPTLRPIEIQTEFVDVLTVDLVAPTDPNVPDKEIQQTYPFGSFGINIGLRYAF
jgi:hypothetical protein